MYLPPLATWASPSIHLSKTDLSERHHLLPDILAPQTGLSPLNMRHPSTSPFQIIAKPTPTDWGCFCSGCPGGTLCCPGLQDHTYLALGSIISKWDLLSQTCSTSAFPALWELMTLSTNEGQGWQSQRSGSQGLCVQRLLLCRCVKCQLISDAFGVQNQLIHRLHDLPRVRLLGPGQRVRESSPGGPWKTRRRQSQLSSHFQLTTPQANRIER